MIVGEYGKHGYRFYAVFNDGSMTLFGKIAPAFIDHHDKELQFQWLRSHVTDWSNPKSPEALERYLLWNKPTLRGSITDYKKIFSID